MINVGIIGMGKMGKIRYQTINNSGRGKVRGIFDPDIHSTRSNNGINLTNDEIVHSADIDAVFICTPNYLNKELTVACLNAGKHVFCEKPPALSLSELREICAAEKSSKKKLMYGFNHRHHRSIQHMKTIIDSGEFGCVLWMRGRYGKSVDSNFRNTWRSKKATSGGGILMDQGIHMLDLFLYLGGDFDEVKAFVSDLYWKTDVEDNVFAIYRNSQTHVVASLHSTMTQWRHLFSLEVFLEGGYLVLNGLKTSSGTYGEEQLTIAKNRSVAPAATWEDEEHITFDTNVSWKSEVDHFFDAIIEDRPVQIGNSSDALRLMRLLDKTYCADKPVQIVESESFDPEEVLKPTAVHI